MTSIHISTTLGIKKSGFDDLSGVTDQKYSAYWHYLECKAVTAWPDDPIADGNQRMMLAKLGAV